MAMTRGGRFARSCRTRPSTFPTLQPSGSTICLSSTSLTRASAPRLLSGRASSTQHLQWNGDDRDQERNDHNCRDEDVADDVVAILAHVVPIVHQDEQR